MVIATLLSLTPADAATGIQPRQRAGDLGDRHPVNGETMKAGYARLVRTRESGHRAAATEM
jgi:hypothetical protein